MTGPVHRKLCRRSCSTGDTGQQSEDKQLVQTAQLDLIMRNNGTDIKVTDSASVFTSELSRMLEMHDNGNLQIYN